MTYDTTTFPNPPYTYNDYRITYNEKCFFYNGGFDLVCLTAGRRRVVGSPPGVGKLPPKSYPQPQMIDLVFKVCIQYVNEKEYKDEEVCEIKRYSFTKDSNTIVRTDGFDVRRKLFTITSSDFNVNTINRFLGNSDLNPSTVVSSSITKLKTYVSSSLHFNVPKKIKIKSTIIKDKK